MNTFSNSTPRRSAPLVLACVAAMAMLSACDRDDNRSAGQKLDATVATAERKADGLKAEAREAANEVRQSADSAGVKVAQESKDLSITAAVKAELARDDKLSALKINVDTDEGRVLLRGTAPDTASRTRATQLAQNVEGVRSVANELAVQARATP